MSARGSNVGRSDHAGERAVVARSMSASGIAEPGDSLRCRHCRRGADSRPCTRWTPVGVEGAAARREAATAGCDPRPAAPVRQLSGDQRAGAPRAGDKGPRPAPPWRPDLHLGASHSRRGARVGALRSASATLISSTRRSRASASSACRARSFASGRGNTGAPVSDGHRQVSLERTDLGGTRPSRLGPPPPPPAQTRRPAATASAVQVRGQTGQAPGRARGRGPGDPAEPMPRRTTPTTAPRRGRQRGRRGRRARASSRDGRGLSARRPARFRRSAAAASRSRTTACWWTSSTCRPCRARPSCDG